MFFEMRVVEGTLTAVLSAQTGEVVVAGPTAELIQCLAAAKTSADGLPRWAPLGDVLWSLGRSSVRLVTRRGIRALIRRLNHRLAICGSASLVQTHRQYGLRLSEPLQQRVSCRRSEHGWRSRRADIRQNCTGL